MPSRITGDKNFVFFSVLLAIAINLSCLCLFRLLSIKFCLTLRILLALAVLFPDQLSLDSVWLIVHFPASQIVHTTCLVLSFLSCLHKIVLYCYVLFYISAHRFVICLRTNPEPVAMPATAQTCYTFYQAFVPLQSLF